MLKEFHYRAILNFFYFIFLDEAQALQASSVAASAARKAGKKHKGEDLEVHLIRILSKTAHRYIQQPRKVNVRALPGGWDLPPQISLNVWRDFYKSTDVDTLITTICHVLVGFDSKKIAQALGVTEGTIQYRTGRALANLGRQV